MAQRKCCPFCRETESEIVQETGVSRSGREMISVYVRCLHCAARGTVMSAVQTLDGTYEEDFDELTEQAVRYWNDACR